MNGGRAPARSGHLRLGAEAIAKPPALGIWPEIFRREAMRGQVLGVDTRTGDGIVAGEDGRRYRFKPDDWAHRGEPAIGMLVDFDTHENRALALFPVPGTAPAPVAGAASAPVPAADRNKFVAALLSFLLGTLGIHRFYLGRVGSAVAMLILSCTVIGLLVTVPWSLVDTVRFLMMTNRDFEARYARADT